MWTNNIIENGKDLSNYGWPKPHFGKGKNKPAIVCGAGYSLDNDLPIIAKNRDMFDIYVVDAAIHPLYKAGIAADWIASIDAHPDIDKFFHMFERFPGTNLLGGIILNNRILKQLSKKCEDTVLWGNHGFLEELVEALGKHKLIPRAALRQTFFSLGIGTVAYAALFFALHRQNSPILISGVDFCTGPKGEGYCRNMWNSVEPHCYPADEATPKLGGGYVIPSLKNCAIYGDEFFRKNPHVCIYNCAGDHSALPTGFDVKMEDAIKYIKEGKLKTPQVDLTKLVWV